MHTVWQDLRYGLRMLARSPGFTAVAVFSLALGIGANTTIFTVVNAVLLHPLPVKDVATLMDVETTDTKTTVTTQNLEKLTVSYPNYKDFRDQNDVFSGLVDFVPMAVTISTHGEGQQVNGFLVTANYFDVLGVRAERGRTFLADEDQQPGGNPLVVVSHSLWMNQFGGDPNLVGRAISMDAQSYTVIGVAPPNFRGTFSINSPDQVWIPISMHDQVLSGSVKEFFNDRRALLTFIFGRLKPGVVPSQAEADLKGIAARLEKEYPVDNNGRSATVSSLADAALGINQHQQLVLTGGLMMSVVGLVLLIACVNLANLLLAQAAKREKEMSLRAALGAGRARLLRQSLTESLVLSLLGGAVGFLLAIWGRNVLWAFRPSFLQPNDVDLSLDAHVLIFTLLISLLTTVAFGLVPALKSANPNLAETLKVGGRGATLGWGRNRMRSLLVVSEIALALVALVGAGLFVRSMQVAQRLDPGFESKQLFTLSFDLGSLHYSPERGQQFFRDAIERARAVPGVQAVTVASNAPLGGGFMRTVFPEGQEQLPGHHGTLVVNDIVTPGYFQTLRDPLLRGRDFNDVDQEKTTPVAIANEAMAKHFWPGQDAIGKRFHFFGDNTWREIVGVVANSVVNQIGEPPQPVVYLPMAQDYTPVATLQVRTTGSPDKPLGMVRSQVQALDHNLALTNVFTIEDVLSQGLWAPRMGAALLTLFGLLALVLASIGVYGVMAYSVTQRTNEIGIRMALGAQPRQVFQLVIGHAMGLALFGLGLGLVGALALTRPLSSLLFGVSPTDPVTYGGVSLLLAAVALLACYLPARRAMRVDPLVALRYE